MVLKRSIFTNF